ncbi:MAG: response regulator transcription factor [Sphingobacteriaceae bacterium]|nr:MAG: response regulator transcription factor [Sphingobacteriaceae bacterium]
MTTYTCIIIDDERKAIELLSDTIEELYDNISIIGTYTSWKEAVVALKKDNFDMLFLDISMPEKSGFDLLAFVPNIKSEIIFVTAHAEFALDAFNYPTSGYILKPVEDVALSKAIDKAISRIEKKAHIPEPTITTKKITIPNKKGLDFVEQADIVFFEALAKNTRIKKKEGEIVSTQAFGTFRDMLNHQPYYQVHRSFIVNVDHIVRYETTGILIMNDGSEIPVAKSMRDDFIKLFGKKF